MNNNDMDLTQCPKREYFTKEEFNQYIDNEIDLLMQRNPILHDTFLIKVVPLQPYSWRDYFGCQDCFVEDSMDLLNFKSLIIFPKYINKNKIETYIVIQTNSKKQNKEFYQKFAMNALWPFYASEFRVSSIKNTGTIIDFLSKIKDKENNSKHTTTNYIKTNDLIYSFIDELEYLTTTKHAIYKKLQIIKNFENKYREVK